MDLDLEDETVFEDNKEERKSYDHNSEVILTEGNEQILEVPKRFDTFKDQTAFSKNHHRMFSPPNNKSNTPILHVVDKKGR